MLPVLGLLHAAGIGGIPDLAAFLSAGDVLMPFDYLEVVCHRMDIERRVASNDAAERAQWR